MRRRLRRLVKRYLKWKESAWAWVFRRLHLTKEPGYFDDPGT